MAEEEDMWERGVRLVSDLNSILEFDPYMYVVFLLLFSDCGRLCLSVVEFFGEFFLRVVGWLRSEVVITGLDILEMLEICIENTVLVGGMCMFSRFLFTRLGSSYAG